MYNFINKFLFIINECNQKIRKYEYVPITENMSESKCVIVPKRNEIQYKHYLNH